MKIERGLAMKPGFRVSASFPFFLSLLLLCVLLPLTASGCARSADADAIKVTYYYAPGCSTCEQANTEVAKLEQDFPGQVQVESLDATTPEAARMVNMLGFKEHGLVIRSRRGAVLWKASSHNLKMDEVRDQLKTLLAHQQQAAM